MVADLEVGREADLKLRKALVVPLRMDFQPFESVQCKTDCVLSGVKFCSLLSLNITQVSLSIILLTP